MQCQAPMYFINDEYVGTYSNIDNSDVAICVEIKFRAPHAIDTMLSHTGGDRGDARRRHGC